MFGIVCGREVCVDSVDREVLASCNLGQRPRQVVVAEPEAVHAGVDFQMAMQSPVLRRKASELGLTLFRGGAGEGVGGRRCRDRGSQTEFEDTVEIADAERAEDEDRNPRAGAAKDDALFDIGAGQHGGARAFERKPDVRGPVAVRVCLDDGDDAGSGVRSA